jgi:hypothetical protein
VGSVVLYVSALDVSQRIGCRRESESRGGGHGERRSRERRGRGIGERRRDRRRREE